MNRCGRGVRGVGVEVGVGGMGRVGLMEEEGLYAFPCKVILSAVVLLARSAPAAPEALRLTAPHL